MRWVLVQKPLPPPLLFLSLDICSVEYLGATFDELNERLGSQNAWHWTPRELWQLEMRNPASTLHCPGNLA